MRTRITPLYNPPPGDEVAISTVFGDDDTGRLALIWQGARPSGSKRLIHLGKTGPQTPYFGTYGYFRGMYLI